MTDYLQFASKLSEDLEKQFAKSNVLSLTSIELAAQDKKWGQQDHPILPDNGYDYMTQGLYFTEERKWQKLNARRVKKGCLSWDGVLLEEVYEALSETDDDAQEVELIQVAAVALQMVMALRRKKIAKAEPKAVQVEPFVTRHVAASYPITPKVAPTVAQAAAEMLTSPSVGEVDVSAPARQVRIYVAGPMSGYADHNRRAFADATAKLRAKGYFVVSPAEQHPVGVEPYASWTWEQFLRADLQVMLQQDIVALLPGWYRSPGARLESDTAKAVGMSRLPLDDLLYDDLRTA